MNQDDSAGGDGVTSPPLHHKESPFFAADRAAYWRHLCELGPVVKIEAGDPSLHGFYLTRRDDVRAALLDPETFASPPKTFAIHLFGAPLRQVPLSCTTRADHARFGSVLHPLFSPRSLAPFEPELRERAARTADRVTPRRQCDAVEVADNYASQALFLVCGLPPDDVRTHEMTRAAVIGDTTGLAQMELMKWLNISLDAGLADPARPPGILWPLMERLAAGDGSFPLTNVDVASVVLLIFSVAGIEMVSSAITFALLHLARDPELRAQLRENPAQIPAFAEEIFRLESPGPAIPRITTREVEIGGVTIPAHSSVWLGLEAAGRTSGDDISRGSGGEVQRRRHWAFGAGMHRCLGMHLARMEMDAFLTAWLQRIPDFDVKRGFTPTVVHKPTSVTHLRRLKLRW